MRTAESMSRLCVEPNGDYTYSDNTSLEGSVTTSFD